MEYNFPVTRTTHPKPRPADESKLGFAQYFTDHMFCMDWDEGQGWHDGRIVPHAPIEIEPASCVLHYAQMMFEGMKIEPASCVLHYAQMMFEGMKAYKTPEGAIQIFRPEMNIARMARTCERMCIPELPGELFLAAVKAVIWEDRDWIPSSPGTALYIRPFIFGDEVSFSVLPAKHYRFMIILTPTGSYYAANDGGLSTTRIFVQDEYIRAARGGTGFAKVGGNYGGGMRASLDAMKYNCKDVLWLDAAEHKYVEEIGTSNAFFRINDEVITAPWPPARSSPALPATPSFSSSRSGASRSPSASLPLTTLSPPPRTAPSRRFSPAAPRLSSLPSAASTTRAPITRLPTSRSAPLPRSCTTTCTVCRPARSPTTWAGLTSCLTSTDPKAEIAACIKQTAIFICRHKKTPLPLGRGEKQSV